jgi:hypothetical protein
MAVGARSSSSKWSSLLVEATEDQGEVVVGELTEE